MAAVAREAVEGVRGDGDIPCRERSVRWEEVGGWAIQAEWVQGEAWRSSC